MDNFAILKSIGLNDNEIRVYLALLELGDALASKIGEKVTINRTQIYDILEGLMEKGIVSYVIMNNRKYFKAASPKRLLGYIAEKESQLKEQEKKIQEMLPSLISLQKPKEKEVHVEIYKGKEGIKTIYNEILRETKEILVLGATGKIAQVMPYYFPGFEKKRIKSKIKLKLLFNASLKDKKITKREVAQVRFLPKSYSSPIPTLVYKDKVVILIWKAPSAIVIEDKEIAQTYRKYFNLLWKISIA